MRRLALLLVLLIIGCSDPDSAWRGSFSKRANALRLFPLPSTGDPNVPNAVFVNSNVKKILIVTQPPGATVKINGAVAGITPCDVNTAEIVCQDMNRRFISFPMEFTIGGDARKVERFALRYEAANVWVKTSQQELPDPLPSRDLWFYAVLSNP
ncbi:MAG: PEGA domain-containing protein [Planctomycetota bacterium]